MSQSPAPRVVLVGPGRWGSRYVAALQRHAALAAVVTAHPETAAAQQERLGVPAGCSLTAMIERLRMHGTPAHAVAVLSPDSCHDGHAREALAAGLPTLVIKPCTGSAQMADQLGRDFAARNVWLLAVHEALWNRPMAQLWRAVEAGEVGTPHSVSITRQQPPNRDAGGAADSDHGTDFDWLQGMLVHDASIAQCLAALHTDAAPMAWAEHVWASAHAPQLRGGWRTPQWSAELNWRSAEGMPWGMVVQVRGSHGAMRWVAVDGDVRCERAVRGGVERMPKPSGGLGAAEDEVTAAWLEVVAAIAHGTPRAEATQGRWLPGGDAHWAAAANAWSVALRLAATTAAARGSTKH